MSLIILTVILVLVIVLLITSLYVVKQQTVAIIERFGKYQKTATSGIHIRVPLGIDKIAARVQLRLLQSEIIVETKTKDNVFVTLNIATQYRVNENNVTDAEVKQSMNEINAAQRKRVAAQELANADKIKIVTAAEAEAEKDRLHGVGIAQQRKAIVDGLADSIQELKDANVTLTEEQIMSILLTNQYLDTLNTFAINGNQTIFLPNNPEGVEDIRTQVLSALKTR